MKKIKVEVCLGTTCFVLGSAELAEMEYLLPDELKHRVEVVACPCLEACNNRNYGNAPFVRIDNDQMIDNATVERVTEVLWSIVGGATS